MPVDAMDALRTQSTNLRIPSWDCNLDPLDHLGPSAIIFDSTGRDEPAEPLGENQHLSPWTWKQY